MADYPYYDEDPKRRARRRRRRNMEDDGWGMAADGDFHDGDMGDIEDWAAGMVDEEGRREQFYNPDRYDDEPVVSGDYPRSRYFREKEMERRHQSPSPDPRRGLDPVERAVGLMDRLNRRTSYAPAPPLDQAARSKRRPDSSQINATAILVMLMMLTAICSCVALLLYIVFG